VREREREREREKNREYKKRQITKRMMEGKQRIEIECIAKNEEIENDELCVSVWMMYVMCTCMYHHKVTNIKKT